MSTIPAIIAEITGLDFLRPTSKPPYTACMASVMARKVRSVVASVRLITRRYILLMDMNQKKDKPRRRYRTKAMHPIRRSVFV